VTTPALRTDLDSLPEAPGVYLMRDAASDVLYVGKAVDLRARVKQYWAREAAGDGRFHVAFLVPQVATVDVVVTTTEREALLLEDTLIKKYQPRYNVKLKDDKSWLSVRLPVKEAWPRITLVRRWKDDGARYFGPYLDEVNAREVTKLLTKTVPLRTCTDGVFRAHSKRPCIEHAMGRCAGPCAGLISQDEYRGLVREAVLLLEGRHKDVIRSQEERMERAAMELRFEDAAHARDTLLLLQKIGEKQSARAASDRDLDVWAIRREGSLAAVTLLPVRDGRLQDALAWSWKDVAGEDGELLGAVIAQLYSATIPPPPQIFVPVEPPDTTLREELLGEILGRRVRIHVPQRGEGRRLLEIAEKNAEVRFGNAHSRLERQHQALRGLQDALRLPAPPRHIECVDNSNIQGTDAVSSLVCFRDGLPWKDGYRIFRVKTVEGADDFATMKEVFGRRLSRALRGDAGWELPDLFVVDGGRGQLAQAVLAFAELGVGVVGPDGGPLPGGPGAPLVRIVSLAKPGDQEPTDKVYEPGRKNPVPLRASDPALHLLQAARDEAHRFGVAHHRKQRAHRTLRSGLDQVPGLGPTLRRRLLSQLGSVKAVQAATVDQLSSVPGIGRARAEAIRRHLDGAGTGEDPAGS
jgi:excinuclease ABC subunit C